MRSYILSLSLTILAIVLFGLSCKKGGDSSTASVFAVSGVTNVTLDEDSTITLPLAITQVSGDVYTVQLSVSGLPSKVSGNFSKVSGTPPFTSDLTLKGVDAAVGTYTVQLTANEYQTTKDYSFDLTIKETPDCIDASFLGTKQAHDICTSAQDNYSVLIDRYPGRNNRIWIGNFGDMGNANQVYADINCDAKTINIPLQSVPGGEVSATGTYTTAPFKMTLNYHLTNGSANEYCTTTIQ